MKVYIQPIPAGDALVSLFVWLEPDHPGDGELLQLHQAPAIAASLHGQPVAVGKDVAKRALVMDTTEVPAAVTRIRQAAAETEAAWRRYDPSVSVKVVELGWASAA